MYSVTVLPYTVRTPYSKEGTGVRWGKAASCCNLQPTCAAHATVRPAQQVPGGCVQRVQQAASNTGNHLTLLESWACSSSFSVSPSSSICALRPQRCIATRSTDLGRFYPILDLSPVRQNANAPERGSGGHVASKAKRWCALAISNTSTLR